MHFVYLYNIMLSEKVAVLCLLWAHWVSILLSNILGTRWCVDLSDMKLSRFTNFAFFMICYQICHIGESGCK